MRCTLLLGLSVLLLVGCQAADERAALNPLPENRAGVVTYAELLIRARQQTRIATEAFYVDNWLDLEDAASALQQTARLLPKATDVPESHKDTLVDHSRQLGEEAVKLEQAAKKKISEDTNKALQQLNLKVRQLKLAPDEKE